MFETRRFPAVLTLAVILITTAALNAQPTAITYQGQLKDNGSPANGAFTMTFRLFDALDAGMQQGATLTFDGAGGNPPQVMVEEGLFSVELDYGAAPFVDNQPRWLEIAVNGTTLTPRQLLSAVPIALNTRGINVDSVGNVGIGTPSPSYPLSVEASGYGVVQSDGTDTMGLFTGGGSWLGTISSTPLHLFTANGGARLTVASDGNIGIGTSTPTAKLEIAGTPGVDGIRFPDGSLQTSATGAGGGPWQTNGSDVWYGGGGVGIIGGSSPFPLGKGVFLEGGSATSAQIFAYNYDALAPLSLILNAPGGNVGIGTASPTARLHVAGSSGNTILTTTSGGRGLSGSASSNFGGTGVYGEHLQALNSGSLGTLDAGVTGVAQVSVNYGGNFINSNAGGIALRSQGLLDIVGTGAGTELLRFNTERPWIVRQIYSGPSTGLQFFSTSGAKNLEITCSTGVNCATFFTQDAAPRVGIATTTPTATLDVNGTTKTRVLQITGADLAEKFPTSDCAEPGTVMEIDPENEGQLRMSQGAYNQRVAGVISGANDFPAGAILGHLPGHEDAPPIALSGRVWTLCDAGLAPINPGDLLTTSTTPGHAMKAVDRDRSHGAVIGKAMTALQNGRGLVLVLVNLQ